MTLRSGATLGPYEILGPLEAGGMGEVYRALDTRLNRRIAIKVLPSDLADDGDRLRRFKQEAEAASALNHPNILTIHDIGHEDGVAFIVMELVQGNTSRDLMAGGRLAPRRLAHIAHQMAEGLAEAPLPLEKRQHGSHSGVRARSTQRYPLRRSGLLWKLTMANVVNPAPDAEG